MQTEIAVPHPNTDLALVRIAREIAINHFDLETILDRYGLNHEEWEVIRSNKRFTQLLESETQNWQSAVNTHERVQLKAAAVVEEWLPEANARIYDKEETLPAKVELAKLITRIAGMGLTGSNVDGATGEKFSVTINLGTDHSLKFEKELPNQVTYDAKEIEGDE